FSAFDLLSIDICRIPLSSMSLRRRSSTLFPYTTLFRSEALRLPPHLRDRHPFPGPGLAIRVIGEVTEERLALLARVDDIFVSALDRKSTRLNSSHVKISYAVFCLIKKKPCPQAILNIII